MATKSAPVILDPKFSVASAVLDTSVLPAYAAGDYILFLVTWYANKTVSSLTAGWSHVDALTTSGAGLCHAAVYKKAASSSEASPTLTLSSSSNFIVTTAYVIKGADATNFLNGGDGAGYKAALQDTAALTITTGALTPANNNALVFCVCGSTDLIRFLQADLNGDVLRFHDNNGTLVAQVIGYKQQNTAAADGGFVGYLQTSLRSSSLTIAIKDDGNNTRAKDGRTSIGRIDWYGAFGTAHDGTTWSANAPSAMAGGNLGTMGILGATVSTTALAAPTSTGNNLITSWGTGTVITTTESANVWSGKYHTHAAKNLTGMLLSLNWIVDNNPTLMGDEGLLVVIADSSNQWIAYQLSNKLGIIAGDPRFNVIDLESGTVFDKSENYPGLGGAAFDFTNHTQTGYLLKRNTVGTGNRPWKIKDALLHPKTGYSLRGGSERDPLTPSFLRTAVCGWGYIGLVGLNDGSAEQVVSRFPVTYGDGGTTLTYFSGVGSSFEYPNAYHVSSQRTFNIPEDELTLNLKAGASDTILINSCAIVAGQRQKLEIDAATSTSANLGFSGAAIDGWLFTDHAGVVIPDATYTGCGTISLKGGASGISISGTIGAVPAAAVTANDKTIANSTIDLTGTDATYHITLPSTVTALTLNTVTLSGTPNNAGADKIYSELASGELVITSNGLGTGLVAGDVEFIGGSTAFATIAAPTVNQKVVLTGLSTTCRVQLYDASVSAPVGSRILYNGEPGTTSYTWTDPLAAVASRAIRLRITDYLGATAKVMIERNIGTCGTTDGTEIVSFNNEFEEDTNYNTQAAALGYNGEDILDIEIDDTTDTVKFNFLAGGDYDARRIYMYMVYWLDTEAGINDDFVFCRPLDPVNLPMEGVVFENVTAPQEIITFINAYVYDATTGRAKDLVVGDGINFAPDHVVQVIATVGGVNIITGHINEVAGKVQEGLTAQGLTETRAAKLDNLDQKVSRVLVSTIATR